MTSTTANISRRCLRLTLVLVAGLGLISIVAPFMNAARFSGRIQKALETSLGRKVSFQEAHFTLLFGPGFSLSDVSISEDSRYGSEVFAYVPKLQA
ncbi:MAG: hypothetical protein JO061_16945, partial [Acidobacteriaceae bacterium]|nr:hypothetical protein [Acidobacteriaceae bacterium]